MTERRQAVALIEPWVDETNPLESLIGRGLATRGTVAYLDSSALIKLVVLGAESEQLRLELARRGRRASSALAVDQGSGLALPRVPSRRDERVLRHTRRRLGPLRGRDTMTASVPGCSCSEVPWLRMR